MPFPKQKTNSFEIDMNQTKPMLPEIHVGIVRGSNIAFKLNGTFFINGIRQKLNDEGTARINEDAIEVNIGTAKFTQVDQMTFIPENLSSERFDIKDVTIGVDFHWEQKENQIFQGSLKLIKIGEEIQVINLLPIEDYLKSVISSEMSANCSLNLLKAHAIISRSWLLAQIVKQDELKSNNDKYNPIQQTDNEYIRWYDREDHTHFHVCADDHCQRYQGITKAHNPNVLKAVDETRGEVLMYQNNICDARFSKACGGVSEVFENCWEPINHAYLTKVVDYPTSPKGFDLQLSLEKNAQAFILGNPVAFCNTQDETILKQVLNNYDRGDYNFFRWKVEYSQQELAALLKKKSGFEFGDILDLIPIERGESGRLIKLKIVGTKKTITVGKELEIRRWLSESHLYSSAIVIEKRMENSNTPSHFIIKGAGWGHGVGLCQIGAAVMGEKGYDYMEILTHYYKNASIEKYYE